MQKLLPTNHPTVINDVNHPLNPCNPRNLQLNPGLNLVFQQNEAAEAENEINYEEVMGSILADEIVQGAASLQMENYTPSHTPHPYKTLGLEANATAKEIVAASIASLAEVASQEPNSSRVISFVNKRLLLAPSVQLSCHTSKPIKLIKIISRTL